VASSRPKRRKVKSKKAKISVHAFGRGIAELEHAQIIAAWFDQR
jgi:hypothetical protein